MEPMIKRARMKAGLSQRELARMIGVSPATMNAYESGLHDPKSDNLMKIAKICGVSVDYLLGFESEKPPSEDDGKSERDRLFNEQLRGLTDKEKKFLLRVIQGLLELRE